MAIDRQMAEIPTKTCTEYDFPSQCFPAFLITDRIVFFVFLSENKSFSVTLDRKATTLCRRVFRTIGWCSGNDLETVLFAMLCLVLLRGLLFATKVHKNSNSPKFPSSFVGVLTQYKKKG